MKNKIRLFAIFLGTLLLGSLYAQNTCTTAIQITQNGCASYTTNNQEVWFTFTTSSNQTQAEISVTSFVTGTQDMQLVQLFAGTCLSNTLVSSSIRDLNSLNISSPVNPNTTYILKVSRTTSTNITFNMCIDLLTQLPCPPCVATGICQYVCEPSFETFTYDPQQPNGPLACNWEYPSFPYNNAGTPDAFSVNSPLPVNAMNNFQGSQSPHTGNAYHGVYNYYNNTANYREYFCTKLTTPLTPNLNYRVTFWLSLADYSSYAANGMGAYFSVTKPQQINYSNIAVTPQFMVNQIITNTSGWVQVSGSFSVNVPGVEYLTIGNFLSDAQQARINVPSGGTYPNYYPEYGCYYYIDDVTVEPDLNIVASINPPIACVGDSVHFTAYSPNAVGNYVWSGLPNGSVCQSANCDLVGAYASSSLNNPVLVTANFPAYGCYDTVLLIPNFVDLPTNVNAGEDQIICLGATTFLSGTSSGNCTNTSWSILNGPIIGNIANCSLAISVAPTTTTTYVFTSWAMPSGCSKSDTVTIFVNHTPDPTLSGALYNDCASGMQIYMPVSPDSNVVYTWVVSGDSSHIVGNNSIDINWSVNGGYLVVTAIDTTTNCQSTDTLVVPPCCIDPINISLNNRTARSVLNDPALAAQINGTNFTYSNHIIINGLFLIDTTFTFLNCPLIDMGGNAKIEVQPTQTLTYDNSQVSIKCGMMWDGIYIQGNTATLNVINQSVLQQAKQAVVSENGGVYFIENSTLQNNYRDMLIKAYALPHTGVVRSTQFTMNSNFLTAFPPLPFGHTSTICGIEIEGNADIQIGDASQGTYQNDFTNIMVGVRSSNSITKVENCSFSHFVPTLVQQTNIPDAGTGVVAIGSKNYNYAPMITVGGATLAERCDFVDVRNGVYAQKQIHVNVLNNNFAAIKLRGISVLNSSSKNVAIEDNIISNNAVTFPFQTGIYVVDVPYTLVNIKRNRVIQTGSVNSQIGTGIHVALVSPSDATVNIMNNTTISRVKTGIYLANLTGQNKVKVSSNYIGFSKPNANYTSAHYGIRLSGCATVLCDTNTVMKSGAAPTQAMIQNLRGISIENSPSTFATDNIFVRMGSGIFGYQISSSSTLACNTLNTCYHGVYFTGTPATNNACDIGDQLIDPNGVAAATGNTWFTNVAQQELNGKVNPPSDWRWDISQPINFVQNLTLQQENYNACNLFFLQPAEPDWRDKEVGSALRTASDSNTTNETRYVLYSYAYNRLVEKPNWLSLGTPDDSVYQNFFNSFDPTNIGFLNDIGAAADTGNYAFVMSAANGMSSANTMEYNLKQVYIIYASSWMQGFTAFTPTDSAMLWSIALEDPAEGGTGVYSARTLLGLDVDDYGASNLRLINGSEEASVTEVNNAFAIYPVPTTDNLTLEYTVYEGQQAQVEMFDLSGKQVYTEQLQPLTDVYTLDLTALPQGVFMLRVVVDGVSTDAKRIILIK